MLLVFKQMPLQLRYILAVYFCFCFCKEELICIIQLGRLASAVERPLCIPRQIKLRDILQSDAQKRFKVMGSPNSLFAARGPGFREGIDSVKPESVKDKSTTKHNSEDNTCIKQLWFV